VERERYAPGSGIDAAANTRSGLAASLLVRIAAAAVEVKECDETLMKKEVRSSN